MFSIMVAASSFLTSGEMATNILEYALSSIVILVPITLLKSANNCKTVKRMKQWPDFIFGVYYVPMQCRSIEAVLYTVLLLKSRGLNQTFTFEI